MVGSGDPCTERTSNPFGAVCQHFDEGPNASHLVQLALHEEPPARSRVEY